MSNKAEFEQKFTHIVNLLCRLDMKYTIVSDEFDEMLNAIKDAHDFCEFLVVPNEWPEVLER